MQYKKSESAEKPQLIDTISSKTTVYIRRNISKTQRTTDSGEPYEYYEYEEAKLTRAEWEEYQKELAIIDIQKQRADIDYIALMSGISLDEV